METTYKVNRQVADSYYIRHDKHSYAYFYITPTGQMFVDSDWGHYCFSWNAFGPESFKHFIVTMGADYFIGKLEKSYYEMKGARAKFGERTAEALRTLFGCLQTELKQELASREHQPGIPVGTNIRTVAEVIATLSAVENKSLPMYAYGQSEQAAYPIVHVDCGTTDRIDLNFSNTVVDDSFIPLLQRVISQSKLVEGQMFDLDTACFTSADKAVIRGFGIKDGIPVVVLNKDSFYPIGKMTKSDLTFMFNDTTISTELKQYSYSVIEIKDCKELL